MATNDVKGPSLTNKCINLISSYGLAVIIMFLLLILTFVGTLAQRTLGLHGAVDKYFTSWYFFEKGIPFPGGCLLMSVLFVNMLFGSILKARKDVKRIGILVSHVSILLLLASGLVTHLFKKEGYLDLKVGETSNEIESYLEWVVEIEELGPEENKREALVIPFELMRGLSDGNRTFFSDKLPFDLKLSQFARNSTVAKSENDGYKLQPVEKNKEAALNIPGVNFSIVNKDNEVIQSSFLWGGAPGVYSIDFDDRKFMIKMTKDSWEIPFAVTLDKFKHEYHPGTEIPKEYSSWVTQKLREEDRNIHITMNVPMRDSGYVLYQESWGKLGEGIDAPVYSQFAVSRNPSDQWPLWCCIGSATGLTIHFLLKLVTFLNRKSRKPSTVTAI